MVFHSRRLSSHMFLLLPRTFFIPDAEDSCWRGNGATNCCWEERFCLSSDWPSSSRISGTSGSITTAFFIPVSLVFIQSALFRFDILEIKSLARESIFENGTDAMILLDDSRSLTDFNLSARFLFPELTSMAKGMPLDRVFGKRGEFLDALSAAASSSDALYRANDGRFFQIAEVRILNRFGNAAGSLLRLTDCTETRRAHARLLERATTDELTGLFNRGAFLARARDEFENSRSMKTDFSLIMIDIDHFKAINDNYGPRRRRRGSSIPRQGT